MEKDEKRLLAFYELGGHAFDELAHNEKWFIDNYKCDDVTPIDGSIQVMEFPVEYMKLFHDGVRANLLKTVYANCEDHKIVLSLIEQMEEDLSNIKKRCVEMIKRGKL